jgi:hypothetical protein
MKIPVKIFYSWQSDLPSKTNRRFIQDCIENAIRQLEDDPQFTFELDRDTLREYGTPAISEVILKKIDNCNIFLADISIINQAQKDQIKTQTGQDIRLTPNPNVFFELGYAVAKIGWNNIICILNSAYGETEDIPFDIRHRRIMSYNYGAGVNLLKINDMQFVSSNSNYTHALTKDKGIWKLFKLTPQREDISSQYKQEIANLNKAEKDTNPEDLQVSKFNEIKSKLDGSKKRNLDEVTNTIKTAILEAAIANLIEKQKKIIYNFIDFLKLHGFRGIDDENQDKSIEEILDDDSINNKYMSYQLTANEHTILHYLETKPEILEYVIINQFGGSQLENGCLYSHYQIQFLEKFINTFKRKNTGASLSNPSTPSVTRQNSPRLFNSLRLADELITYVEEFNPNP